MRGDLGVSRVAPATAVPGTVVPERLVRLLDATPADRPSLVLVTAPPGYGKTTLVAEWCARQERPPVWCRLAGTEHMSDDLGDLVGHALGSDRAPPPLVLDAIAQPFFTQMALSRVPALRGGVALVATLVGLVVTVAVTDGMSISGLGTWLAATLITWLVALVGVLLLPVVLVRRKVQEHRD